MSQLGLGMGQDTQTRGQGRSRLAVLAAGGIVLVLVLAGFLLARSIFGGTSDYPGPGEGSVAVEVAPGASLRAIGGLLEKSDVVKTADAFVGAAELEPLSRTIGPGRYAMRLQMSGAGAVELMLDPASRIVNRVVIPEGSRLSAISAEVQKVTGLTREQIDAALADPALGLPSYAPGPEGYLFPATYEAAKDATALAVLQAMTTRFSQAAGALDLEARAEAIGRTPAQIVTIASLLEAEAKPEDFAKVSRVVYNRLAAGMPLQFDSTVNFVLNRSTIAVSTADTKVDSPYNTYANKGLPPGPIGSPGEVAMQAALAPEDGDWLYFVTVNPSTGETKFTSSYAEFLEFKKELKANTP